MPLHVIYFHFIPAFCSTNFLFIYGLYEALFYEDIPLFTIILHIDCLAAEVANCKHMSRKYWLMVRSFKPDCRYGITALFFGTIPVLEVQYGDLYVCPLENAGLIR